MRIQSALCAIHWHEIATNSSRHYIFTRTKFHSSCVSKVLQKDSKVVKDFSVIKSSTSIGCNCFLKVLGQVEKNCKNIKIILLYFKKCLCLSHTLFIKFTFPCTIMKLQTFFLNSQQQNYGHLVCV